MESYKNEMTVLPAVIVSDVHGVKKVINNMTVKEDLFQDQPTAGSFPTVPAANQSLD